MLCVAFRARMKRDIAVALLTAGVLCYAAPSPLPTHRTASARLSDVSPPALGREMLRPSREREGWLEGRQDAWGFTGGDLFCRVPGWPTSAPAECERARPCLGEGMTAWGMLPCRAVPCPAVCVRRG